VNKRKQLLKEEQERQVQVGSEGLTAAEEGIRAGGFFDPLDGLLTGLFTGLARAAALDLRLSAERNKALAQAQQEAKEYEAREYGPFQEDMKKLTVPDCGPG
jgi:hypothetical protein